MSDSQKNLGKGVKVMLSLFLFITLLFVLEGILSIALYQQYGPEKAAAVEVLKTVKKRFTTREFALDDKAHNLVRPDSSNEVNRRIAEEAMESNRFIQESWIEFRNMDYNGRYMHMSGVNRKSSPDKFYNDSNDTLDIYFFGGSTMFGFNVMDNETIPSQFVELYKQKYPNGKSIRVHNFGTPTYYSYQELILLSNLIYNGHQPDVAVFLDGINDFWFATAAYYRQSYFSYVFRQVFDKGLRANGNFQLVDTADKMFMDPKNVPLDEYNSKLVVNYFENISNIKMMCDLAGINAFFFVQPSPFYNYPNQQKDPICFKDTNTRFNYIYPLVKKQGSAVKNFTFLGDMLEHENGYPFIDGLHYSPEFIKKVAAHILDAIKFE